MRQVDAILVAPGFGARGVEGKIAAADYARENERPFPRRLLRHADGGHRVCAAACSGLKEAHTEEVMPDTPHPLIHILPEQKDIVDKGATMRLGAYKCQLVAGSLAERLYGTLLGLRAASPPL